MAGHSFGEYSALVCAGALDFETAVAVVADRGRFMQEAVPVGEGAMAAILGLDEHALTWVQGEGQIPVVGIAIDSVLHGRSWEHLRRVAGRRCFVTGRKTASPLHRLQRDLPFDGPHVDPGVAIGRVGKSTVLSGI